MSKIISFYLFLFSAFFLVHCNNPEPKTTEGNQLVDSSLVVKDSIKEPTSIKSEITCPKCGHKKMEEMPTDVCLLKYTCEKCSAELRPKEGDCCVFCTYGTHKCPSIQEGS